MYHSHLVVPMIYHLIHQSIVHLHYWHMCLTSMTRHVGRPDFLRVQLSISHLGESTEEVALRDKVRKRKWAAISLSHISHRSLLPTSVAQESRWQPKRKLERKKRTFSWILMQSIRLLESAKTVQFCLASAIVKMTQTSPLFASFPFVILCAWICLLLPATNAISCYQCNSMPLASKKSECPGQSISFGDRHDVS